MTIWLCVVRKRLTWWQGSVLTSVSRLVFWSHTKREKIVITAWNSCHDRWSVHLCPSVIISSSNSQCLTKSLYGYCRASKTTETSMCLKCIKDWRCPAVCSVDGNNYSGRARRRKRPRSLSMLTWHSELHNVKQMNDLKVRISSKVEVLHHDDRCKDGTSDKSRLQAINGILVAEPKDVCRNRFCCD